MAKTNKKKSSKNNKKTPKKVKLVLKKPPFSSPGQASNNVVKREKSVRLPDIMRFEILQNPNYTLFWVERPNGEASYMQPLSRVIESNTKEGKDFRECTNILAPLISRRVSREDHRPILSKHPINVKRNQVNYPFRCLLGIKTDDIPHEDYVDCVMNAIKDILTAKSNYPTKCTIDLCDSDVTPPHRRSLDSVITDKSIQTVLYRYFYSQHLTDDNFDNTTETCDIPKDVTKTFVKNHPNIAAGIFTPLLGKYSVVAKLFGCTDVASTQTSTSSASSKNASPKPFFLESESDEATDINLDSDSDDEDQDSDANNADSSNSFINDSSSLSQDDSSSTSI